MITNQPVYQAAAIPVCDGQVCLIGSSNGKRWIIPKGRIEADDRGAADTAVREAWEEAGVVGRVEPEPIGAYQYEKCGRPHHVTVFLMRVTQTADRWPECDRRPRRWSSPWQALALIQEGELRALIDQALSDRAVLANVG